MSARRPPLAADGGRRWRLADAILPVGRVAGMAGAMLGIGWFFLGDTNLTPRQLATFGIATAALAWAIDATIRAAVAE